MAAANKRIDTDEEQQDHDPVEDLKKGFRHRLNDELYISFLISFIIWNWRPLVYLLHPAGEYSLAERLTMVDDFYFAGATKGWWGWRAIVAPFIGMLIAVAGLPWFRAVLKRSATRAIIWSDNSDRSTYHSFSSDGKELLRDRKQRITHLEGRLNEIAQKNSQLAQTVATLQAFQNEHLRADEGLVHRIASALAPIESDMVNLLQNRSFTSTTDEYWTLALQLGLIAQNRSYTKRTERGDALLKYWEGEQDGPSVVEPSNPR